MKKLKDIAKLLIGKHPDANDVSIEELNASLLSTNEMLINEWTRTKP